MTRIVVKRKPMDKKLFLVKIKELGVNPNFFISEHYLNQPDIKVDIIDGNMVVRDDEKILFPALPHSGNDYWCSYLDTKREGDEDNYSFFDYNFIYNPASFLNLSGGTWESFRKNVRKFQKINNPLYLYYPNIHNSVESLFLEWISYHPDLQDGEFIWDTLCNPPEDCYIKYLIIKGELIAINFADYNYKYINYRFLICKKVPFADEYARYMFYTDPYILRQNMLVNDGGSLGSEKLYTFKLKLNPLYIFKLYSYENRKK